MSQCSCWGVIAACLGQMNPALSETEAERAGEREREARPLFVLT